MVGGIVGLEQEIKRRILATTPTLYTSDHFVFIDEMNYEGENNNIPIMFRHFAITIAGVDPGDFAGGYNYAHHNISLTVSLMYSEAGATRVVGDSDINMNAFIAQDVIDMERGLLKTVILTDNNTSARLIRQTAQVNTDQDDAGNLTVRADIVYALMTHEQTTVVETVPRWTN